MMVDRAENMNKARQRLYRRVIRRNERKTHYIISWNRGREIPKKMECLLKEVQISRT
jgi:hypothetical protein